MATFGQGINPQLGAIDYSPILRGSLAGAQMAAQGSQMIGQGIASLGEEAGKGFNVGILYLAAMPFGIMGYVAYKWWKNEKG